MSKKIFILDVIKKSMLFVFCISGCSYTPPDFSEEYPAIAAYQKPYSLGITHPEKRWEDVEDCGGKQGDKELIYIKNSSIENKFVSCMIQKGYVRINSCGRKYSMEDKGVCNE